jgi:hypothetical protein
MVLTGSILGERSRRPPPGRLAAADFLVIAAGLALMMAPPARHVGGYLAEILPG